MGHVVIVLLVALWALILIPGVVRGRRESSPIHTVLDFERSMSSLSLRPVDRSPGRTVLVLAHPASVTGGSRRARVLARRRAALKGFAATLVTTGMLALVAGDVGALLFAMAVAAAGAYLAALHASAARAAEARAKTRRLVPRPQRAPARMPAPHRLRRTGT